MRKNKLQKGFTLTEIVVTVTIFAAILMAVFNLGQGIFSFNTSTQKNLNAQNEARKVLKVMAKELRSASPSSNGAYPLSQVSTSTLVFYSNVDADAYKEQIRYFMQNGSLKKATTKPSGSPLSYNPANEQVVTLINKVSNGVNPIFEYYDSSYTGTSSPLSSPVSPTAVRLIRVRVLIERDVNKSEPPMEAETQVFLRNLKDNL